MSDKRIDIDSVLATFSSNLADKYRSPEDFNSHLSELLTSKFKRGNEKDYIKSLEKNIVFLSYFTEEGKALLALMMERMDERESFNEIDPGLFLSKAEERIRKETGPRHRKIFGSGESEDFVELLEEREKGEGAYIERLEFFYSYLMAIRTFMVDFMNILYVLRNEYTIENIEGSGAEEAWSYIEMMANYYIGNIKIGEASDESEKPNN